MGNPDMSHFCPGESTAFAVLCAGGWQLPCKDSRLLFAAGLRRLPVSIYPSPVTLGFLGVLSEFRNRSSRWNA